MLWHCSTTPEFLEILVQIISGDCYRPSNTRAESVATKFFSPPTPLESDLDEQALAKVPAPPPFPKGPEPPKAPESLVVPVATPARAHAVQTGNQAGGAEPKPPMQGDIPVYGDTNAEVPKAGELLLSENAISLRLRRVFQPNPKTGEFRVADNIRKMYLDKKGKGKTKILQIFQSCGFDPDRVMSKQACPQYFPINICNKKRCCHQADTFILLAGHHYSLRQRRPSRTASSRNVNFFRKNYYRQNLWLKEST